MTSQDKRRHESKYSWRRLALTVLLTLAVVALFRAFVYDMYYVPSESMEPGLLVGDRIVVDKVAGAKNLERFDVVVFDGRGSLQSLNSTAPAWVQAAGTVGSWLGFSASDSIYVKRVVGLPGDTVTCCSPAGKLQVNGTEVNEPYLFDSDKASETNFSVHIPQDRIWVMGDHRSASLDSRYFLGKPGGGMVPVEKIIGPVTYRVWPFDRFGELCSPANG